MAAGRVAVLLDEFGGSPTERRAVESRLLQLPLVTLSPGTTRHGLAVIADGIARRRGDPRLLAQVAHDAGCVRAFRVARPAGILPHLDLDAQLPAAAPQARVNQAVWSPRLVAWWRFPPSRAGRRATGVRRPRCSGRWAVRPGARLSRRSAAERGRRRAAAARERTEYGPHVSVHPGTAVARPTQHRIEDGQLWRRSPVDADDGASSWPVPGGGSPASRSAAAPVQIAVDSRRPTGEPPRSGAPGLGGGSPP